MKSGRLYRHGSVCLLANDSDYLLISPTPLVMSAGSEDLQWK